MKLQDLSNKKKVNIDCINQETEGKSVIENFQTVKYKDAYNDEHAKSLQLKDLNILYRWKYRKNLANGINEAELLQIWITAKNAGKQNKDTSWTTQEEEGLVRLECEDININDT